MTPLLVGSTTAPETTPFLSSWVVSARASAAVVLVDYPICAAGGPVHIDWLLAFFFGSEARLTIVCVAMIYEKISASWAAALLLSPSSCWETDKVAGDRYYKDDDYFLSRKLL